MQLWLGQVPSLIGTRLKEMLQKSMAAKRFTESHRLIRSANFILVGLSAAILLMMLILTRAIANSFLPFSIAMVVYEAFWVQLACFISGQILIDFLGRGLLLAFK